MRTLLFIMVLSVSGVESGFAGCDDVIDAILAKDNWTSAKHPVLGPEIAEVVARADKPWPLYSTFGECATCTANWIREIPALERVIVINEISWGAVRDVVPKGCSFRGHFFLLHKDSIKGEEIIFDPTYLQFIGGAETLNLPRIFIGTRSQLKEIFETYRSRLRFSSYGRPLPSDFNLDVFINRIYGFGRFSELRKEAADTGETDSFF